MLSEKGNKREGGGAGQNLYLEVQARRARNGASAVGDDSNNNDDTLSRKHLGSVGFNLLSVSV